MTRPHPTDPRVFEPKTGHDDRNYQRALAEQVSLYARLGLSSSLTIVNSMSSRPSSRPSSRGETAADVNARLSRACGQITGFPATNGEQ